MRSSRPYRLDVATLTNDERRFVIIDDDDRLHIASSWLATLAELGRSPNTTESYGRKVVAYLNWTVPLTDWRTVSIAHLVMWRRTLSAKGTMELTTVDIYISALRSFYEWAGSRDLVPSRVVSQMSEVKYFPAGAGGGGEHGAYRRVTSARLSSKHRRKEGDPPWIDNPVARERLENLNLSKRNRFLVDLLYFTGIRAGEALCLFTADMHLGGGTRSSGCGKRDPHLHVRMNNPVTNGARAKGMERILYTNQLLVDGYVDYLIERDAILSDRDTSPHMLVNLYNHGPALGDAMKYDSVLDLIQRCGSEIDFPLNGPHMLRHTFATRLARGIDCLKQPADVIQELLGHRSAQSTKTYTHGAEARALEALMAMSSRRLEVSGV